MNETKIEAAIRQWVEAIDHDGVVITIDMADAEVQNDLAKHIHATCQDEIAERLSGIEQQLRNRPNVGLFDL